MLCRGRRDLGPRALAGIEQAHCFQLIRRRAILRQTGRLHRYGPMPVQPQPAQILHRLIRQIGPAARAIDILDPQQKFSPMCQIVRHHGGIGMAQMQGAIGAGGKAGADHRAVHRGHPSCGQRVLAR
jgi:hypothetical protein